MLFTAFLHQTQLDFIADHHQRAQRARQIIQIQRRHLLEPRHLTKRVVVRKQTGLQQLRRVHQSRIHRCLAIVAAAFVNGQFHLPRMVELVQKIKAAAAALALHRVARIRQCLQFIKNKSRHDE